MAELYMRLVNARDVKQEELFSPQPFLYYMYKYPSLVCFLYRHMKNSVLFAHAQGI